MEPKDYGQNNSKAYDEGECPLTLDYRKLHTWDQGQKVGRCITEYKCVNCGAFHTIDSSD
jgi:hypothetical protein